MRICEVVRIWPTHRLGGMPLHALTLCRGLARRGHDVHVLTTSHPRKKGLEIEEGIKVHYLKGTEPGKYSGDYTKVGHQAFARLNKEKKFDVIHSESSAAQFLLSKTDVPTYMTLHGIGMDSMQTNINFAYRKRQNKELSKNFLKKASENVTKFFNDCIMFHKFSGIVAISDAVYDDLIVRFHIPRKKVHLIYNGIDETHFKLGYKREAQQLRSKLGLNKNNLVLLSFSMLQKYKGIGDIIKAMPSILQKIPNAKLVIAGKGEDEGNLKKMVEQRRLKNKVHFVGNIAEKQAPHYYNMCDVFFNGSIHHSGLDLTLQEAIACGRPIVACDVGSKARSLVYKGVGKLYALDDIENLAQATIDLLQGDRAVMRKNALDLFKKKFTLTKMIDKLEKLFARK